MGWLELSQDEKVIDIGSGPGFLCEEIAEAVGPVLDALQGYSLPASFGRLAAMRADFRKYADAPRDSSDWRQAVAGLQAALERPSLILKGQG